MSVSSNVKFVEIHYFSGAESPEIDRALLQRASRKESFPTEMKEYSVRFVCVGRAAVGA